MENSDFYKRVGCVCVAALGLFALILGAFMLLAYMATLS